MGRIYPDDDDGDALRRVEENGADMSVPMKIEFSIDVPSEKRAHSLAERISSLGYAPHIFIDDESGSVSIYCAKTMLATHEGVVAAQSQLNELCVPFDAECDGWITAGNRQGTNVSTHKLVREWGRTRGRLSEETVF
jgi:hypothetical protein